MIHDLFRIKNIYILIALCFVPFGSLAENVDIVIGKNPAGGIKQAAEILRDYLIRIYPSSAFAITDIRKQRKAVFLGTGSSQVVTTGSNPKIKVPEVPESYVIANWSTTTEKNALIRGYDQRGLIYGVYALLEHLGCRFYLTKEVIPGNGGNISFDDWNFTDHPLVKRRILFNWHNFLSGCTGWNLSEYKRWIDRAVSQKYNSIMVHAYGNNPMYRFSFNGRKKHSGYIASSQRGRDWGTTHVNDVRNIYGGERFTGPVFGSAASRAPEKDTEKEAVDLMKQVFNYARDRSLDVIFAFDIATPSANPGYLLETLPSSARLYNNQKQILANPETAEGYAFLKSQISGILNDYPGLNYLVPWVRYMSYPAVPDYFTVETMPENWKEEIRNIVEKNSGMKEDYAAISFFYLGKVMAAYAKVLKEVGRDDVKLGVGTWNWVSFPYLDKFLPLEVEFFPIDWDLNFESNYARNELVKINRERKVYPIVWAHHDDHSYIGSPLVPPVAFPDRLDTCGADGFGILHWTTWPLDLYFKNLSRQVWNRTRNELYATTIRDYAIYGEHSDSETFNQYLRYFYRDAPRFGRETSDFFFDILLNVAGKKLFPVQDPDKIVKESASRLSLLDQVKKENPSIAGSETYLYYRGMEEFILRFFEDEKLMVEAVKLTMSGDVQGAKQVIGKTNPENTILRYAEAIRHGPGTKGEEAILLSLNTRWLPDFMDIRQKTGLIPVRYKFYPVNHEPLSQGSGRFTYFFEKGKDPELCLGTQETSGGVLSGEQGGYLLLSDSLLRFTVGYWRKGSSGYTDAWKDNRLLAGKYRLEFLAADPDGNIIPEMKIGLQNDEKNDLTGGLKPIAFEKGTANVHFNINHSSLTISLQSAGEPVRISGFSITREEN